MKTNWFSFAALFLALTLTRAAATTYFVNVSNSVPLAPYTNWTTAATNIQDAVDVASAGDQIFVTNGIYQAGFRQSSDGATNRVVVTNAIAIQSVNGSRTTVIDGGHQMRCVYLADGASLNGFTVTNGNTGNSYEGCGVHCTSTNALVSNCLVISNSCGAGGGIAFGTVSNCILIYNHANVGGGAESCRMDDCYLLNNSSTGGGGGASAGSLGSILNNCFIMGNSAGSRGGGAQFSILNNCLVVSNTVSQFAAPGGGTYNCALNNCTVVGNSSPGQAAVYGDSSTPGINTIAKNCIIYYNSGVLSSPSSNCCAIQNPSAIHGGFTNAPLFVNMSAGDFRLQTNSPCINAGNNSYTINTTDLDGHPRIVGGTVDIGAYEFQSPSSVLSYAWAQQYGLPTDGSADFIDADGDGMNNWQEWIAGVIPTNSASLLLLNPPTNAVTGLNVSWPSVNTRTYYLQRSTNLLASPTFSILQSNLVGGASTTSFTDASATNGGPYFYRVGVQ